MLRQSLLVPAVVVLAACGPKGPQAGQVRADSTAAAVTDSAMSSDSSRLAPSADSVVPASTTTSTTSTTSKATSTATGVPQYIGRDSAFGPTFTVDSTGKVTPIIPAKKKP